MLTLSKTHQGPIIFNAFKNKTGKLQSDQIATEYAVNSLAPLCKVFVRLLDYYGHSEVPDCLSLNSEGYIEFDQSKYKGNNLKASIYLTPGFGQEEKIVNIMIFNHYDFK